MIVERIAGGLLLVTWCIWALIARPASAGQIVGVTFSAGFYNVDPLTGDTTQLLAGCSPPGCGPYFGASASPSAGRIYTQSVVNIWDVDPQLQQFTILGGYSSFDLAFDRITNIIYATDRAALFTVACPSPPGPCFGSQIGPGFPTNSMQALGFAPGFGLYGVGDNNLYFINRSTGIATLIGFTGLLADPLTNTNVTDLAYDSDTGRLIASVGCLKQLGPGPVGSGGPCDASNPGSIYWIDRFTGNATLLNGNAPQLMGLAEAVPEPGSGLPVAVGLGALLVWYGLASFRNQRSSRHTSSTSILRLCTASSDPSRSRCFDAPERASFTCSVIVRRRPIPDAITISAVTDSALECAAVRLEKEQNSFRGN